MGLEVADHLQAMLQPSKEPIRAGQGLGVVLGHVPLSGQDCERAEGVRLPEPFVATAVDDLEELDGELHVADPAPPTLDLGSRLAPGSYVLLQADLHPADLLDGLRGKLLAIDERGDHLHEGLPQLEVAGHRPGLAQGLPFPGHRLRLVVRTHRGKGASERPSPAPGAKRRIDPERDALGRHLGEQADDLRGLSLGPVAPLRLSSCPASLGHEEHVDVRGVIELGPSELAQTDHRKSFRDNAPARQ